MNQQGYDSYNPDDLGDGLPNVVGDGQKWKGLFQEYTSERRKALGLSWEQVAQGSGFLSAETARKYATGERFWQDRPMRNDIARALAKGLKLRDEAIPHFVKFATRAIEPEEGVLSLKWAVHPNPGNLRLHMRPDAFIGRTRELDEIGTEIRDPKVTLLTVTGPGAVGKSRLSIRAAYELVDLYHDGINLVPLSTLSDPTQLIMAVGNALGIRQSEVTGMEQAVLSYLKSRSMLLLLDTFEHLLPGSIIPLLELMRAAPHVKVLVTSRHLLGIGQETAYRLEPMNLPHPDLRVKDSYDVRANRDAVQLFAERAGHLSGAAGLVSSGNAFRLSPNNIELVEHICQKVDGLPLAIELAARKLREMTLEQLESSLTDRLRVLQNAPPDVPAHHRSIWASIAWSYNLLAPLERRALRAASVFQGGFTAEALAAVAQAGSDHAADRPIYAGSTDGILVVGAEPPVDWGGMVGQLSSKSMVIRAPRDLVSDVPPFRRHFRFDLLDMVREFGLKRLQQEETQAGVHKAREAHAEYFRQVVQLHRKDYGMVGPEVANISVALKWSEPMAAQNQEVARSFVEAVLAYRTYLEARGLYTEGIEWVSRAITVARKLGDRTLVALALIASGGLNATYGEYAEAKQFLHEALSIGEELGPSGERIVAAVYHKSGHIALLEARDYGEVYHLYQQALQYASNAGEQERAGGVLGDMAYLARKRGLAEESLRLFEEARHAMEGIDSDEVRAVRLSNLSDLSLMLQKYEDTLRYTEQGLAVIGATRTEVTSALLGNRGLALTFLGHTDEGYAFLQESLEMARQLNRRYLLSAVLNAMGDYYLHVADLDAAEHVLQESRQLAREIEAQEYVALGSYGLGKVMEGRGQWGEALKLGTEAHQALQSLGSEMADEVGAWLVKVAHKLNEASTFE